MIALKVDISREVSKEEEVLAEDKFGAVQFRLPGSPFVLNAGKESATIGKVFAIRVFEEMNRMGYDLVASSDLSRAYDQSSWQVKVAKSLIQIFISILSRFFKKVNAERARQPVLCIAPGSTDKIVIVRGCEYVIDAVRDVINEVWSPGMQNEKSEEVGNERLYEFKLRGNPWYIYIFVIKYLFHLAYFLSGTEKEMNQRCAENSWSELLESWEACTGSFLELRI